MKYIICIFLILLFSNCSKDKYEIETNVQIKLSSYSVHILAGNECIIDVFYPNKELSLIEENSDIVSGWWANNGKAIIIKGENIGCASIYVQDNSQPERKVEIKVTSEYFSGNYREDKTKATLIVETNDQFTKKKIETDLMNMIQNRAEKLYSFNKETGSVVINTDGDEFIGTYSWDINSLTIKNDKTTEKYIFRSNEDSSIEIEKNLTDKYQQLYPDQRLYNVRLVFYLLKY